MIRWADPGRMAAAVEAYAEGLRDRPEVVALFWYGSWVDGRPTPSSDVDLCLVVTDDDRHPRDRLPSYFPDRFPAALDLLVLTEEELASLEQRAPGWHRAILAGREVLGGTAEG